MGKEFAIYIASYMQYSYTATFTVLNKIKFIPNGNLKIVPDFRNSYTDA